MYSATDVSTLPETGFPIQKSPDQSLFSSSPKLIAAYHVFHRLLTPRHPPFALNSLVTTLNISCWTSLCTHILIVKEQKMNNQLLAVPQKEQPTGLFWLTPLSSSYLPLFRGGGERARTDGLLRARQALSQLSYTPNKLVRILKFETDKVPMGLSYRFRFFDSWWAWMELNHRPHAYQACALTKLSYRPWGFFNLSLFKNFNSQGQTVRRAYYSFIREHNLISQN